MANYSDHNPRNVGDEAIVRQPGICVNQKMETGLTALAIIAAFVMVVGGCLFNVDDWYTPPEWPKVMPSNTIPFTPATAAGSKSATPPATATNP